MTLGSLFDGAGGFPFAAQICGIEPIWASEIEPFPIAVTRKRFPNMKHLGDVTKVNGADIEPVDIITFGSPCQDLSVAGKRAGLGGARSGLFMEAVRIIKEMRGKTNGEYPSIAVWENVPGAFSSNKGEDFRIVLEELCKVKAGDAVIPRPAKGKWSDAGEIVGDGYSVAWRVLDAQFWGVPQRRRRIFLVADFGGECAGEILFERGGLPRNFAESRESWKGISRSLAFGSGAENGNAVSREYGISSYDSNAMKSANPHSGVYEADTARTLDQNGENPACNQGGIAVVAVQGSMIGRADRNGPQGSGVSEDICFTLNTIDRHAVCVVGIDGYNATETGEKSSTLGVNCGISTGRNGVMAFHLLQDPIASNDITPCLTQGSANGEACIGLVILDRAAYNQGQNAQFDPGIDGETGKAFTVIAKGPGAVCYAVDVRNNRIQNVNGTLILTPVEIILRRLTPTECARLQGMPDWYCDDIAIPDPTEEDMAFWREVFETYRRVVTQAPKPKTDKQIRKWLAGPVSDAAQYKMWGNGMALPCVLYVLDGVTNLSTGVSVHGKEEQFDLEERQLCLFDLENYL